MPARTWITTLAVLASLASVDAARAEEPASDEPCPALRLTGEEDETGDVQASLCVIGTDTLKLRARRTATACDGQRCTRAQSVCLVSDRTDRVVFEATGTAKQGEPAVVVRCRKGGAWLRVDKDGAPGAEIPLEWNATRSKLVPAQETIDEAERLMKHGQSAPALQRLERYAVTFEVINDAYARRLEDAAVPLRAEVGDWTDDAMRVLRRRLDERPDDPATQRAVASLKKVRAEPPFRLEELGKVTPLDQPGVFGPLDDAAGIVARRVVWQGRRLCVRDETTVQRSMKCWSTDTRRWTALEPMPPSPAGALSVIEASTDSHGTCPSTFEGPELDLIPEAPRDLLYESAVSGSCVARSHGLPVALAPSFVRVDDRLAALVTWRGGPARLEKRGLVPLDTDALLGFQRRTEGAVFVVAGRLRLDRDFEVVPRALPRATLALATTSGLQRRWPLPTHWQHARASPDGNWIAYVAGTNESPWLGVARVEDARNVLKKPAKRN